MDWVTAASTARFIPQTSSVFCRASNVAVQVGLEALPGEVFQQILVVRPEAHRRSMMT
ncbi:MAG TPA: hypothetical protein VHF25_08575 [Nitriliruptorales bacterium]|nr:hypothetical protein [Nitriliruptorales bacterium]